MKYKTPAIIFLFIIFLSLDAYSGEEDPSACDCRTIVVSAQEEQDGCPASVKREACTEFYQMEQWQMKLRQQRELRRLEEQMIPRVPKRQGSPIPPP